MSSNMISRSPSVERIVNYANNFKNEQKFIKWHSPPKAILVVTPEAAENIKALIEIKAILHHLNKDISLFVEEKLKISLENPNDYQTFKNERETHIDLVISLGGDGTLLYAISLFQSIVPVFLGINFGTLGFLVSYSWNRRTKFKIQYYLRDESYLHVLLRSRLSVEVISMTSDIVEETKVMNEVVIDRGISSTILLLDIFVNGKLITVLKGDGVIVSTPSGSTAYSLSAGASAVYPTVVCFLITPICPHSLSFRPIILPPDAKLEIKANEKCRTTPWITFDGVKRFELSAHSTVLVEISATPIPCLENTEQTWFDAINQCLNWNIQNKKRTSQSRLPFQSSVDKANPPILSGQYSLVELNDSENE